MNHLHRTPFHSTSPHSALSTQPPMATFVVNTIQSSGGLCLDPNTLSVIFLLSDKCFFSANSSICEAPRWILQHNIWPIIEEEKIAQMECSLLTISTTLSLVSSYIHSTFVGLMPFHQDSFPFLPLPCHFDCQSGEAWAEESQCLSSLSWSKVHMGKKCLVMFWLVNFFGWLLSLHFRPFHLVNGLSGTRASPCEVPSFLHG